jgi:hypothetical protein
MANIVCNVCGAMPAGVTHQCPPPYGHRVRTELDERNDVASWLDRIGYHELATRVRDGEYRREGW